MKYCYCINDEELSPACNTIEEVCENAVDEINSEEREIYRDSDKKYVLIEITQVQPYEEDIDGEYVLETLRNTVYNDLGYGTEDYLDDVNIPDFEKAINKFWQDYKVKNKINKIWIPKDQTTQLYKLFIEQVEYGYKLISYEEVKED